MTVSYRTRRRLKRAGLILLAVLLAAGAVWGCWMIWLQRYVIYDRDKATIDFHLPVGQKDGQEALPPSAGETVAVAVAEDLPAEDLGSELTQLNGYYVDGAALKSNPTSVAAQIRNLPATVPILLDMKAPDGSFYYGSALGPAAEGVDTAAVDALIAELAAGKRYLIARVPALQDRNYGLNHVDNGLFLPGGAGLWMDDESCYWLDPATSGTQSYLMRVAAELREKGFDEVLFSQFRFPDGDGYTFDGDKAATLTAAAKLLVTSCATETFAVSFSADGDFTLPEGRCRLYFTGVEATAAAETAARITTGDAPIRAVFLTESNDTRYDVYSVLRPLDTAH